jgi:hypothetical protein
MPKRKIQYTTNAVSYAGDGVYLDMPVFSNSTLKRALKETWEFINDEDECGFGAQYSNVSLTVEDEQYDYPLGKVDLFTGEIEWYSEND